MDYDESFNITFIKEEGVLADHSTERWVHQIILAVFFVIGITTDIIITYAIYKCSRLRSMSYMCIVNWAIADLCCLLVTPSGYGIICFFRYSTLPNSLWCFLEGAGSTLHVNVIVCVMITTLDWFLGAHFGRVSDKFRRNYKFVIGFIWVLAIGRSTIATVMCVNGSYAYIHQNIVLFTMYGLVVLTVIIAQISRFVQKCRKVSLDYPTLTLTLATGFVICSVLSIIGLLGTIGYSEFVTLAICLLFSSSVVNISLLYFLDKDFHACLHQLFKCSGNRYEETISDNDTTGFANNITISFDNNTEQLSINVD